MNTTEPFRQAREAALRFLSYRPRSEKEVRARLQSHFSNSVVEEVVETLKEQSLVNDTRFATSWKENRETLNPRSARAIKKELLDKGINGNLAEETVQDIDDDNVAYRASLKLARRIEGADFYTFQHRLLGYLRRRGFTNSVSRRTAKRVWQDIRCQINRLGQDRS